MELTPMVMSLEVAKAQYSRKPTNDVYNPYSGANLARRAYAIPCGTTTNPTVTPTSFKPSQSSFEQNELCRLTSDNVANQPLEVVVKDPVPKREETLHITTSPSSGGLELQQIFLCSRLLLVVGIDIGG